MHWMMTKSLTIVNLTMTGTGLHRYRRPNKDDQHRQPTAALSVSNASRSDLKTPCYKDKTKHEII